MHSAYHGFPELKVTSENVSFYLTIQFTVIYMTKKSTEFTHLLELMFGIFTQKKTAKIDQL